MLSWKTEVSPDKYFYCKCGTIFKDIDDMISALKQMHTQQDMESFAFHANNNNNDFANWVYGVFGLKDLAENIRDKREPGKMLAALNEYKERHAGGSGQAAPEIIAKPESREPERDMDPKERERLETLHGEEERLKKHIAELTEESDFLFDKVKKMRMNSYINRKNIQEKIAELYESYNELAASISDWRKKGCDMLIPSLKLKNLKSKMKFLEISQSKQDYDKVLRLFQEIKTEINDESVNPILDMKQQILAAAGVAKPKAEE